MNHEKRKALHQVNLLWLFVIFVVASMGLPQFQSMRNNAWRDGWQKRQGKQRGLQNQQGNRWERSKKQEHLFHETPWVTQIHFLYMDTEPPRMDWGSDVWCNSTSLGCVFKVIHSKNRNYTINLTFLCGTWFFPGQSVSLGDKLITNGYKKLMAF